MEVNNLAWIIGLLAMLAASLLAFWLASATRAAASLTQSKGVYKKFVAAVASILGEELPPTYRDLAEERNNLLRLTAKLESQQNLARMAAEFLQTLLAAADAAGIGIVVLDDAGREMARNEAVFRFAPSVLEQTSLMSAVRKAAEAATTSKRPADEVVELLGTTRRFVSVTAVFRATPWPLDIPNAEGPDVPAQPLLPRAAPSRASGPADARGSVVCFISDITPEKLAERARTDFVANISHEIKTPISAIALNAELLEDTARQGFPDEADRHTWIKLASSIRDQADKLAETIDRLLELSKLETEVEIPTTRVDLRDLLSQEVLEHRARAEARGVDLLIEEAEESHGPWETKGNEHLLRIALRNLIRNAIDYTPAGGRVAVSLQRTQTTVRIVVADTGIGIPESALPRIFERFFRVRRDPRYDPGGVGLGLALVKHVALAHGGSVGVESVEGEGSRFWIELPAKN